VELSRTTPAKTAAAAPVPTRAIAAARRLPEAAWIVRASPAGLRTLAADDPLVGASPDRLSPAEAEDVLAVDSSDG
jgi:hypothetical protein